MSVSLIDKIVNPIGNNYSIAILLDVMGVFITAVGNFLITETGAFFVTETGAFLVVS
jgi:hypothetical protein